MKTDTPPVATGPLEPKVTSQKRNLGRALVQLMHDAFSWRGPGANPVPLWRWLLVIGGSWLLARALMGVLPGAILLPPMIALSVAYAAARGLAKGIITSPRVRTFLRRAEGPMIFGLFALAAWVIFGFVWKEKLFIESADNQFLSARALETAKGLAEGRWARWTHMLEGGDSLVDFYPMGVTLVTALGQLVMGVGSTDVLAIWTALVVLTWVVRGVAAYHLARRFSHPLIALAIATGACLEIGSDVWDGVWNGAIYFGMLSSNVALSLCMFGTSYQIDLCRRVTGGRLLACAALFSVAALVHPLGALMAMVSGLAVLVATMLRSGSSRRGLWSASATFLGMCAAGFWLVPYQQALARFGFNQSSGGLDYLSLGKGFLDGSIPVSSFAAFTGFGLIAVTAALTTKRLSLVAQALCVTIFWMMTVTPFLLRAGIYETFPGLLDGQMRRMMTVVKTAAIPALAWLLSRAYRQLRHPPSLNPRAVLWRALVLTLIVYGPGRALTEGIGRLTTTLQEQVARPTAPGERLHTGKDHIKAFEWLEAQRRADPSPTPWRLALYWTTRWRHAVWDDGFSTGIPIVDYVGIVGQFFSIRPRERTVTGFHDWNIKYAMTDHPSPPAEGLTKVHSSGSLHVWEVPDYDDRFVVAPEGVQIRDLVLEGDRIRFVVEGAPPKGVDLRVRCAWMPRWRATLDGKATPVVGQLPRPDAKPKQEQISLHVGNGTVELTCDGTMPGLGMGVALSLLSLTGLAFATTSRRRRALEDLVLRAREDGLRLVRRIGAKIGGWHKAAAALLLVLVALGSIALGRRRLSYPAIEGIALQIYEAPDTDSGFSRCQSQWWSSEYRCTASNGRVIPGMALTVPQDDSGEFGTQHPGIRVELGKAGSRLELRFSGIRTKRGTLHLVTNFWGRAAITIRVGEQWLAMPNLASEVENVIPIPDGLPSVNPVILCIEAINDRAVVTLAARVK